MATLRIDEINQGKFDYAKYIDEYFEPMEISEEQKDERKKASRDFRDFLLFLFALLAVQDEYSSIDWAYFEAQFVIEFERNALKYARYAKTTSTVFAAYAIVCLLLKPNLKIQNVLLESGKR